MRKLQKIGAECRDELGILAEVFKVEDVIEIAGKGVMALPAMIVNDELKVAGRVAPVAEIKKTLEVATHKAH